MMRGLHFVVLTSLYAAAWARIADADEKPIPLPEVPEGFRVGLFAKEPAIRNPASMAFDRRGRLFVGQGPQFRHPKPDTPGDSIKILIDTDDDGVADQVKTFATGFNCIQSLAWKGRDLWVANAPDLTIVRDTDGDDRADEYVLVYTDLGNLEHGLHGLTWGPDGKLYMSKGNSKGLTRPGRIAPLPFRQLWDVKSPPGAPDHPALKVFKPSEYNRAYHNPADDWGRQGGVLRCDDLGRNLEIVCRGFRNPWDIALDDGFNWLGTDNDQNGGDKIMMPFHGAHFGWGHAWSADWKGEDHPPTAPPSGPFFEGSGTGVVYCNSRQFPPSHRNVFFVDDWLRGQVYVFRPKWQGALLRNATPNLEVFAKAGKALFKPTDIEVGPDGSLYVLGWGRGYGATYNNGKQSNEGRVFRIWHAKTPRTPRSTWYEKKRTKPYAQWTMDELVADLGHHIPVWRVDAAEELLHRGPAVKDGLLRRLKQDDLSMARQTAVVWTLGRSELKDHTVDEFFAGLVEPKPGRALNLRIQAIRILAHRIRESRRATRLPAAVVAALKDSEPRIRFAAVQAIWQTRQKHLIEELKSLAAKNTDRLTFYSVWGALRDLAGLDELKSMLRDPRPGVRRAALLALLDQHALKSDDVLPLRIDQDAGVAKVAGLWLGKTGGDRHPLLAIEPDGGNFVEKTTVKLTSGLKNTVIHYTLDGNPPTAGSPRYKVPITMTQDTVVQAALFRDGRRLGPIVPARFHRYTDEEMIDLGVVHNIAAASGKRYVFAPELKTGQRLYTDRAYTLTKVPETLDGASYLMTANDDSGSRGERFLSFSVGDDVVIHLGHDVRDKTRPKWMKVGQDDGFRDTGLTLASNDTSFRLYQRRFAAGRISLGGNTDDGRDGGRSNYVVIVSPAPPKRLAKATKTADVLPLVEQADAARGRRVFFRRAAAGCARCHMLGKRGNNYAPNLSDIGLRAKPPAIVQSILEPSAVITEGFHTQLIVTTQGRQLSGIVLEESGLSLKLVQTDGRLLTLPKKQIDQRRTSKLSAMPDNFGQYLTPQQLADLTAFLISCKVRPEAVKGKSRQEKKAPSN